MSAVPLASPGLLPAPASRSRRQVSGRRACWHHTGDAHHLPFLAHPSTRAVSPHLLTTAPSCPREPETGRGAKALRAPSFCLNRASSSQHPTHNGVGEQRPFLSALVTDTVSPCVTSVSALLCTGFPWALRLSTSPFHRCCACPFLRHWSLSLSCKTCRIAASTSLFVWSALELPASRCGRAAGGHCCHVFSQLSSKAAYKAC